MVVQEDIESVLHLLADAASEQSMQFFREKNSVENKWETGFDPVTQADKNAEIAIRKVLAEQRPDDAILGEEFGLTEGKNELTWVLDPIDGTRSFILGQPTWGTLAALCNESGPIWGIMDQPFTNERFIGGPNIAKMFHNGAEIPLKTRACSEISKAHIVFPSSYRKEIRPIAGKLSEIYDSAELGRASGDCYRYALIAMGGLDAVIDMGLQSYDICAMIPIVESAGGIVTDWDGNLCHDGGKILACGDKQLHSKLVEVLSKINQG